MNYKKKDVTIPNTYAIALIKNAPLNDELSDNFLDFNSINYCLDHEQNGQKILINKQVIQTIPYEELDNQQLICNYQEHYDEEKETIYVRDISYTLKLKKD